MPFHRINYFVSFCLVFNYCFMHLVLRAAIYFCVFSFWPLSCPFPSCAFCLFRLFLSAIPSLFQLSVLSWVFLPFFSPPSVLLCPSLIYLSFPLFLRPLFFLLSAAIRHRPPPPPPQPHSTDVLMPQRDKRQHFFYYSSHAFLSPLPLSPHVHCR